MLNRVELAKDGKSATVRLRNVRLSFPALFKARSFDESTDPTYQSTFLMPKENDPNKNAAYIKQAMTSIIKAAFKGKHPGAEKVCLKDGAVKADRDIDGYTDEIYFVGSSSKKRVPVVDTDRTPLSEEDNKPYAGCYVNATIRLWAQDNKYGKRVNAQLKAVQFYRDGEPFGEGNTDPDDEFEDCSMGAEEVSSEDLESML